MVPAAEISLQTVSYFMYGFIFFNILFFCRDLDVVFWLLPFLRSVFCLITIYLIITVRVFLCIIYVLFCFVLSSPFNMSV